MLHGAGCETSGQLPAVKVTGLFFKRGPTGPGQ